MAASPNKSQYLQKHSEQNPAAMSFAQASGISTTYGTSYYALKQRGDLKPGETLLVLGAAGGVGLAAVELGKAMGARVIAAASSKEKLSVAKAAGADDVIDYSDGELKDKVKALTAGKGADVIYDPVGGAPFRPMYALYQLVRSALGCGLCGGGYSKSAHQSRATEKLSGGWRLLWRIFRTFPLNKAATIFRKL